METYTFIGNAVKSESGNHGFPIKFSGSLYKKTTGSGKTRIAAKSAIGLSGNHKSNQANSFTSDPTKWTTDHRT